MRRKLDIFKTLVAAAAIAFASTVSAVHVHDITTCDHGSNVVVQNMHDLHDCIFCSVVCQTITAEAVHARMTFGAAGMALQHYQTNPLFRISFDWYGRAPPLFA
ncbi:MAG: hypothetical protein EA363_07920 [Balneolaceae bacterium]|nr:MAG: hypothetical protein EA363_07920 [Balneolaceae bacterium]